MRTPLTTVRLIVFAGLFASWAGCRRELLPTAKVTETEQVLNTGLLPGEDRARLKLEDLTVSTHAGDQTTLKSLLDRPTAITFFYTRCDNPNKCACTVGRFGALQRELAARGLGQKTRLLVFTYEPQEDSTEDLKSFAGSYDLELNENVLMVRADRETLQRLIKELAVPVSYSDHLVTLHGMCVYLVDSQARLALAQRNGLWTAGAMADHLERLAGESAAPLAAAR